MSPLDLSVRDIPGKNLRYHLYTKDRDPAVCVSTVLCRESHVLEPPPKGLRQKWISGVFHTQEWERTVGAICTVFGEDVLQAQLVKDAIQFTTRALFGGECRVSFILRSLEPDPYVCSQFFSFLA